MRMKRFFAIALTLCMMLTMLAPSANAVNTWYKTMESKRENILFELLNGDLFDLNLFRQDWNDELKIEKIEDDQQVQILIILDDLSVVEMDAHAVYGAATQAQMDKLSIKQDALVAQIENKILHGGKLDVHYSYTWLLNGIATQVPYGLVQQIQKIPGVKQVLLQPRYEVCEAQQGSAQLMTTTSSTMIGREAIWESGYTGKGMKIAIVDTGLDEDHPNFAALPKNKLTKDSYDASDIKKVLSKLNATKLYNNQAAIDHTDELKADDLYRNSKVIFGFNYADKNLNITHDYDTMGDHGTHVAGIAAANKIKGSDVAGVAPDAQLYIMKVYGADHGGYAEDILAALEDALILGADVVNMSLGTNAGFTTNTEDVNAIYNRVTETNTVLSVAAGNNYTSGYGNTWGTDQNQTMYPDNAVISQPGVYHNVLSVASVENTHIQRRYIAAGQRKLAFVETSLSYGLPSIDILEGTYGLVHVPNYGAAEDFEGLNLKGKIALVQRGVESFLTKCENATAAGAVACIVYNNEPAEFGMDLTDCKAEIPCISIMMEDGEYLLSQMEKNSKFTISFPKELTPLPSQFAHQMSDFSSWGVAPDLSLEPDITAPGGNIYSTINNGEYGLMSGTSMAAPNMAGLVALVMQYAREHNLDTGIPLRELVQNLLVSTAVPVLYDAATGLHYSPRQQGSGLGNGALAIQSHAYLTVEGTDTPKAELGDDDNKSGKYSFTFQIHNFGTQSLYYRLHTLAQTEDFATSEEHPDRYFMAGTPKELDALTQEKSDGFVLIHDVNDSGANDAYDAYLVYLKTLSEETSVNKNNEDFRYDMDGDETIAMNDVQDYLNALVGLDANADLEEEILQVEPGQTVDVSVSVKLTAEDKAYFNTYYPNGGYVEGYTILESVNDVDLSLPYLGFFGDWDAADILDNGFYWELLDSEEVTDPEEPEEPTDPEHPENPSEPEKPTDPENPSEPENPEDGDDEDFNDDNLEDDSQENIIVGNQYVNVLWTEFYGMNASFYPGFNPYVSEEFDISHVSISPNGDGYIDTVDDIYVSLLRNARYLTFRYVDADTGEVYYEQTAEYVSKSVYAAAYGQILPTIYSWLDGQIMLYNFTDHNGKTLPNNTHLKLQVEAVGDYEGATKEMWEVPITVDLEKPELLSVVKTQDDEGKIWLELAFKDNLSVSAVALMNSNGQETYYMEATVDTTPDKNGYRNYTAKFDITDLSGKLMIVLSDYALNEVYYGINLAGEGSSYGELIGYQYNFESDTTGWVAFGEGVEKDEIQITMDEMDFEAAEYINGFVFAQTDSGALYGFPYADMLADRIDVSNTFIAQLERTYYDFAYDYVTGTLYGLTSYKDSDGYPNTEIYTINLWGEYTDETTGEVVEAYQETWWQGRGGLYSLCITVDETGTIYLLGTNDKNKTELWSSYDSAYGTLFEKRMTLNEKLDYAQSMTYDHNNGTLYWAQFYPTSIDQFITELYAIDVEGKTYQAVGTLSGETCGLFSPLKPETVASNPVYQNVPPMDPDVVGRPVLRKEVVNMNVGAEEVLLFDFDPWFTSHKDVIWSSSNTKAVTVDENGKIVAVGKGEAIITVAAADDPTRFDTCTVTVTELTLEIEGIISSQGSGVGNSGGTRLYKYVMDKSVPSIQMGNAIYAPSDKQYGLDMATSVYARGYIWTCEYGNTGMIYKIDPESGEVVDVLMPVDGDMLFGLTYNENLDTFTGIMNMYLFVDLEMTQEEQEKMLDSYDQKAGHFTYHRLNMLEYLRAAGSNFVTGEYGQGASSEIVMCGITTIADSYHYVDTGMDFLGEVAVDSVNYNSTQTLVVLDNVGRLWYIDEICGMTKKTTSYSTTYTLATDSYTKITSYTGSQRMGIMEMDNGDGTYNVFYIRAMEETPLTDMFRNDRMPRITYHFSDIEFGGYTSDGAPIFAMSLYDYWNNGITNELYLYIPELTLYDEDLGETVKVGKEKFYHLGTTGQHNIIASIHGFKLLGGLED